VQAQTSLLSRSRVDRHSFATFLVVTISISLCVTCLADLKHKPWIEKDWTRWSATDCLYVRSYSPWVSYNPGHGRETGPSIGYDEYGDSIYIQLISALPIREGKLRELQITKSYSRMNPDRRQAFDLEHAADLSEGESDPIQIRVEHSKNTPHNYDGVRDDSSTTPIRQAALVLSDGSLVTPVRTIADHPTATPEGVNAATYVFPRSLHGKPLYSTTDRFLTITFGCGLKFEKNHLEAGPQDIGPFHSDCGLGEQKEDFAIQSLVYKGKLEY
jgi:hypothetical protein